LLLKPRGKITMSLPSIFRHTIFVAACSVALIAPAHAENLVLTFDDIAAAPASLFDNLNYRGFIFSPTCHIDLGSTIGEGGGGGWTSNYIGTDGSGCNGSPPRLNPNYIGPATTANNWMYITRADGTPFTLQGFQPVAAPFVLSSSAGGNRAITAFNPSGSGWAYQSFSGPDWTDVQWLLVTQANGGTPKGFDNFAVQVVPEPAAYALMGLGLFVVGWVTARRRRQSQSHVHFHSVPVQLHQLTS
jgi:PEP-CTERM motif